MVKCPIDLLHPFTLIDASWPPNLRYVLPSNACLLEFVIAIGFEILACKVYKRGESYQQEYRLESSDDETMLGAASFGW